MDINDITTLIQGQQIDIDGGTFQVKHSEYSPEELLVIVQYKLPGQKILIQNYCFTSKIVTADGKGSVICEILPMSITGLIDIDNKKAMIDLLIPYLLSHYIYEQQFKMISTSLEKQYTIKFYGANFNGSRIIHLTGQIENIQFSANITVIKNLYLINVETNSINTESEKIKAILACVCKYFSEVMLNKTKELIRASRD